MFDKKTYGIRISGIYVEVSRAVYIAYYKGKRRMKYFEEDLKVENIIVDQEKETVIVIPSREDSYERLLENGIQLRDDTPGPEDAAIRNMMVEKLRNCLTLLSDDEFELINAIYCDGISEHELEEQTGRLQQTINYRKKKILKKLRHMMEK